MTTSTVVIEPTTDNRSARQVARDTRKHEAMARKRLTSKGATIAAIVIAFFWTIPTFGLFITSFRPGSDTQSTVGGPCSSTRRSRWTTTARADLGRNRPDAGAVVPELAGDHDPGRALRPRGRLAHRVRLRLDRLQGRNFFFIFIFALQIVPLQMALVPLLSLFSRG